MTFFIEASFTFLSWLSSCTYTATELISCPFPDDDVKAHAVVVCHMNMGEDEGAISFSQFLLLLAKQSLELEQTSKCNWDNV